MQDVYNQNRLGAYEKKYYLGMRLATTSQEIDVERRRQGKTLRVVALSQGNCRYVPSVRVAGKWLRLFGFEIGDDVVLKATRGQISITKEVIIGSRSKSQHNPGD